MSATLSDKDRQRVAAFIEHEVGIQLPASKHSLVETRLRKRQRALGMGSLSEYIDYVLLMQDGLDERLHMVDVLTTNKTDFYREPFHFEYLLEQMKLLHRTRPWNSARPFKIWSAGCSSGEEPYTMAIELSEFQRQFTDFKFQITATDVSVSCLQKAKRGVYTHARIEPIDLPLRKRYLLRSRASNENLVRLAPEIRDKIEFKFFNFLASDFNQYTSQFDVIFCRNVMIYFNNEDRSVILRNFANCLKKDGMLFIGHSETLPDGLNMYKRLRPTIYQSHY